MTEPVPFKPLVPIAPVNLHLLGLFIVLNVADVVVTHLSVSFGIGSEGHQILPMLVGRFGWLSLYWFKIIAPLLLTTVILQRPSERLLASRWFTWFLVLACVVSMASVCSSAWTSSAGWHF